MPTYEYVCSDCGNTWEDVQKISEPALTTCPKCKNETAKRQISGGSFILKGGGWYADAYSSKPKSGDTSQKPSSDTKSDGKSDAKSETKSEAKTETKKESVAPAAAPAAAPAKKD